MTYTMVYDNSPPTMTSWYSYNNLSSTRTAVGSARTGTGSPINDTITKVEVALNNGTSDNTAVFTIKVFDSTHTERTTDFSTVSSSAIGGHAWHEFTSSTGITINSGDVITCYATTNPASDVQIGYGDNTESEVAVHELTSSWSTGTADIYMRLYTTDGGSGGGGSGGGGEEDPAPTGDGFPKDRLQILQMVVPR